MVKQLFHTEPDLDDTAMGEEPTLRPKLMGSKVIRRRPSISTIHHEHSEEGSYKNTSSSSHSSYSSSAGSLGYRKTRHHRNVIPCTVMVDLTE